MKRFALISSLLVFGCARGVANDQRHRGDTVVPTPNPSPSPEATPSPKPSADPTRLEIRPDPMTGYLELSRGHVIVSGTQDNPVGRMKFTAPVGPMRVTRLSAMIMNLRSARSVESLRLFDKDGKLFCSGALDDAGLLRCSNDAGLFTVTGDHIITIKVNTAKLEPVGTAVTGDILHFALYIGTGPTDTVTDDIRVVDVGSKKTFTDKDAAHYSSGDFYKVAIRVFGMQWGSDPDVEAIIVAGSSNILHLTKPSFQMVGLTTALYNAEVPVFKWNETADAAADMSQKRLQVYIYPSGVSVGPYRLFRGATDITDKVSITAGPVDLKTSSLGADDSGWALTILWKDEEVIAAGTSKTYELRARVKDASPGDSLTHFIPSDGGCYVTSPYAKISGQVFVWSDMSAADHSEKSTDWTNGCRVDELPSLRQTLSL